MQTPRSSTGSLTRLPISSDILYDEMEIGMPFTGLNGLSEGPLLQYVGNLRWLHLSALSGVPSKQLTDSNGERLYSTFFYVEIAFPKARPMASYGENDRIGFVSVMKRFGHSMLDGVTFLMPRDSTETSESPLLGIEAALAKGIPAVRMSNIFVKQFAGAEWLKKSRPANRGFEQIPESALAPDSYTSVKQAQTDGYFALPRKTHIPMTDGPVKIEYWLMPDRDLNGAGLVYFANYPVFLDIAERTVLRSAQLALTEDLIDRRTILHRKSAYLNNASAHDTLDIEVEPFIENPFLNGHPCPEIAPIQLFINYRMYRRSDHRLMMVSTAEKIIFSLATFQ
jgi:probable biosynthetic protein (TIGR04098 family)